MDICNRSRRSRWAIAVACSVALLAAAAVVIGVRSAGDEVGHIGPYSDAELGIDSLAADSSAILLTPYALHPTREERRRMEDEEYRWARDEAVGYERERWWFERAMRSVAINAYGSLPVEVGAGGALEAALHEGFDECAADSGWPGVQLYDVSSEYVEQLETERNLSLSAFLDLRHKCSVYAMRFPSLNATERDRLLRIRERHFADAMRAYIEEHSDIIVPLRIDDRARTPFNDMLVEICLSLQARADQEHCAEEYRIQLN